MTPEVFFDTYTSDTTAGSSNQVLARFDSPVTRTGRVSYRLSRGGERYSLLFSNRVDSTFSDGSISRANDKGGDWSILSLRVGLAKATGVCAAEWHTVTFDGQLAVHDIKVIYARDKFFIVMPSRKNPDETYRDIVHPINAQFRGVLESAVVEAYEAALAQQEAEQAQAAAEAKEAEDPATV